MYICFLKITFLNTARTCFRKALTHSLETLRFWIFRNLRLKSFYSACCPHLHGNPLKTKLVVQSVPCSAAILWSIVGPHLTRALWQVPPNTSICEAVRNLARNFRCFSAKYLCHIPQGFLTCREIMRQGAKYFTSPRNKVVLRFFIALKFYGRQQVLNLRTLGKISSMITIRSPRPTCY
jgi:hypothetical protein